MKRNLIRQKILNEIDINRFVSTWHWNDFFGEVAKIAGWPPNDIFGNQRRLRYHLNKLVKEGVLEKKRTGVGMGMKTIFNHSHSNTYARKGTFLS